MSPKNSPAARLPALVLVALFLSSLSVAGRAAENARVPRAAGEKVETFRVHESWRFIWVDTHAPYSPEIENETQSRELAKQAATVVGQDSILRYIQKKRTAKGRTLEEAQIPSTDIQDRVKAFIRGAEVSDVRFDKDGCRLRVLVRKKNLKVILHKA